MEVNSRELGKVLGEYLLVELIGSFKAQGHSLTGKFEESLEYIVKNRGDNLIIEFLGESYGKFTNMGVKASRIPFSGRGNGRGRKSKYIEGLIRYVRRRMGFSRKRAERVAFAIASKHKREGMPTNSSKRFSRTGKRVGWIEEVLDSSEDKMVKMIEEWVEVSFELLISNFVESN